MEKDIYELNNMIQLMNVKIENLSAERNNYGNIIFVCDSMMNMQKYVIVLGSLICLMVNGLKDIPNFFASAISGGAPGVLGISIAVLVTMLYFNISKIVCTKKFRKLETEILVTEDLKHEYQLELRRLRELNIANVSTKNRTIYMEDYNKQLNEIINNKMAEVNKPKKLTLKKKK